MSTTDEYTRLEAEAAAKRKEAEELEATLATLQAELAALEEELVRRRQAVPLKPAEERLLLAPSPIQEAERRRKEILEQLGWQPPPPIIAAPAPPAPAPKITLGEAIVSPEWWRENWPWLGVGVVGLVLIAILAKT